MTNTPAKELVTNEQGAVIGVIAEREGEKISVMAKRAVVLTSGGFEYNEAMKQSFLPCGPFYALGSPGNTGDGIIMAQKVGAALWHMAAIACPLGFKAPEYEAAFDVMLFGDRFIYVDIDGKRFANETELEMHEMWRTISFFDSARVCYPRLPTYAIFDDVTRRKGPLAQKMGVNMDYEWSLDNSKEIAKGWISRGKTMRELAQTISVDESTLEDTVKRYNESCRTGVDADFSRSKESLGPIGKAPYYAITLWPSLLNTQGGPRRDKNAMVLNYEGTPISRLYSAGELGSLWGFLYEAAGNLTECLAFGRIAGRNAAAEKPW
jgi:succinate dehydrogenase/fumarate reductase flavoprotein subunit